MNHSNFLSRPSSLDSGSNPVSETESEKKKYVGRYYTFFFPKFNLGVRPDDEITPKSNKKKNRRNRPNRSRARLDSTASPNVVDKSGTQGQPTDDEIVSHTAHFDRHVKYIYFLFFSFNLFCRKKRTIFFTYLTACASFNRYSKLASSSRIFITRYKKKTKK